MRGADFDIMSSQRDRRSLDKIKHCGVDGVLFLPSSDKVSTNALRFEAYINTSSSRGLCHFLAATIIPHLIHYQLSISQSSNLQS